MMPSYTNWSLIVEKKKRSLAFLPRLLWICLKTFLPIRKWKINCAFSCALSSTFLTQTMLRSCSKTEIKQSFLLQIHGEKGSFLTSCRLKLFFGKDVYSYLYTDVVACIDSGEVELRFFFFSPDCSWKTRPLDGRKSLFWGVLVCFNPCTGCHDPEIQCNRRIYDTEFYPRSYNEMRHRWVLNLTKIALCWSNWKSYAKMQPSVLLSHRSQGFLVSSPLV